MQREFDVTAHNYDFVFKDSFNLFKNDIWVDYFNGGENYRMMVRKSEVKELCEIG